MFRSSSRSRAPLMDLTRRLKRSFDPAGILNPGRMYGEI